MKLQRLRKILGFFTGQQSGSALILTMFILAGMMMVAFGGAYLVLLGLKTGGIQSQSTKAYYGAEAGAERLLWELRQNGWVYNAPGPNSVFEGSLPDIGANYKVYFPGYPPTSLIFDSVGEFRNTKRSIEIQI